MASVMFSEATCWTVLIDTHSLAPHLTWRSRIAYFFTMLSGPLRLIAFFLLAISLCILSGVSSSALAVAQSFAHASDCCPTEQPGSQEEADCCVSPECQCLSCQTIECQQICISLAGASAADSVYHEDTALLTGGNYRTIDYPPEIA
jgi:hypothetical protein